MRVVLDGRVGLRREEPLLILAEGDAAPATPASVFVLLYCVTSNKVQRLTHLALKGEERGDSST